MRQDDDRQTDRSPRTPAAGAASDVRAANDRLLATMALLKTQGDLGRDYIALFEPFAIDRLKAWEAGKPVGADTMAAALSEEFGIPALPVMIARNLLRRPPIAEMLTKTDDGHQYVIADKAMDAHSLAEDRAEMLAYMTELADGVVRYAAEHHGLTWTTTTARSALELLTDDFGADLALAKRNGMAPLAIVDPGEALAVVHAFARHALARCPSDFAALERMVRGTIVVNALYMRDAPEMSTRLKKLNAYLDTRVVLRAIGLSHEALVAATGEMLDMLDELNAKACVFDHTITEMKEVLQAISRGLRAGRPVHSAKSAAHIETMDAITRDGMTASDIDELSDGLEERLREIGIRIRPTPPYPHNDPIDETRFEAVLGEVIAWQTKGAREKDIKSLTAVHRLRMSSQIPRPSKLAEVNAVFATHNGALVRASRQYFAEDDLHTRMPICMLDLTLAAHLWLRSSSPRPDLPRKLLIAEAYAALGAHPQMWGRWVEHIERLRERGEITQDELVTLACNQQVRADVYAVTRGDPDAINDQTPAEILQRHEQHIRDDALRQAREAEERAEQQRVRAETLESQNQATEERLALAEAEIGTLTAWKRDEIDRRARRHKITGIAGAIAAVLVFAVLIVIGVVDGPWWWAGGVTITVLAAAGSYGWGTRKSRTWPFKVLIAVGAIAGAFGVVWAIADSDDTKPLAPTHRSPRPAPEP